MGGTELAVRAALAAGEATTELIAARKRIAELEAALSEIHSTARRTTQTHEWYLDGLRYPPGEYVIMRVGPVPDGYEPTF